jgi:hypothetical protein
MSFASHIYKGDLVDFMEQATLNELRNALYETAEAAEFDRASGKDFYAELGAALEYVFERGVTAGKEAARQEAVAIAEACMPPGHVAIIDQVPDAMWNASE